MNSSQGALFYKSIQESYIAEKIAVRVYLYEARRVKNEDLAILLRFIANTEYFHSDELKSILRSSGIELKENAESVHYETTAQ